MQKFLAITPLRAGFLVTILVCALFAYKPETLEILELQMIDLRFHARGPLEPGPEVIIAVVDEKSQDVLGRWPWPRSVLAKLINKLTDYNVFTIGFDMVFSESGDDVFQEASRLVVQNAGKAGLDPEKVKALRESIEKNKTGDEQFAEALRNHGNSVLGFFFHDDAKDIQHLSAEQIRDGFKSIEPFRYKEMNIVPEKLDNLFRDNPHFNKPAVEGNLPIFTKEGAAGGYFNLNPDPDGIMRNYPLVMKGGDHYYAPFWLHMIANYRENPKVQLEANEEIGITRIISGGQEIPVNLQGDFLINYYGGGKTFKHYSISDILEDKISPDIFDSTIVLIGATGKGIFDLRATPFQRVYPGVEINATIIDNIIHENYLKRPLGFYELATFISILSLGSFLTVFLTRVRPVVGFVSAFGLLGVFVAINLELFMGSPTLNYFAKFFVDYQWIRSGYVVNLVYPSLSIVLVYLSVTTVNYFQENKQKRYIRGAFGQFLSPTVVKQLEDNPDQLKLGGEQKRMTAFFSDVAGFSGISEKLTPAQLVELLNEYLTAMTNIVLRYEGTIDKYEGDAIIAFWGAPINHPDHALRACLASLEMQTQLDAMRKQWKEQGRAELEARIGLNTGLMVIGNMGSTMRMDYTMMGDSVNLASRLEGVNKVYGTNLMISQFTYEDVKDQLEVRELDRIRVVGKNEPVAIYEILAEKGGLDPETQKVMDLFASGLAHYRKKQWTEAIQVFNQALEIRPEDGPSKTFIERCEGFKNARADGRRDSDKAFALPEDWDGVFQMTSK